MTPARLAVLGIALASGAVAMYLASGSPPPQQVAKVEKIAANTVDVLVIASDVPVGNSLQASDMRWIAWPADSVPDGVIRRDKNADAEKEIMGSLARVSLLASEPVRREKLIKTEGTGYLSAILPSGKRAVAINTDSRGANTAGGFILPNDRVDIVRTSKDEAATRITRSDVFSSDTILSNVRVLAIGQNIAQVDGKNVVIGETATLELDQRQAETIALSQKIGQLSLALRSLADAKEIAPPEQVRSDGSLTLVRFGVPQQNVKP
jgi:pilus assembly protein CpaB